MKCANCKDDALYEYRVTLKSSLFYCGKHLPKFLELRKKADLIPVTEAFNTAKEEAIAKLSAPKPEPVVEEAPTEEKPKKRAPKKKAE